MAKHAAISTGLLLILALTGCAELALAPKAKDQALIKNAKQLRKSGNAASAVLMLQQAASANPNQPDILQQLGFSNFTQFNIFGVAGHAAAFIGYIPTTNGKCCGA